MDPRRERIQGLSVAQILDILEEEDNLDDVAGIGIMPPAVREESDQDSADEEPQAIATERLSRFQLLSEGHFLRSGASEAPESEDDESFGTPSGGMGPDKALSHKTTEPGSSSTSSGLNQPTPKWKKTSYKFQAVKKATSSGLPLFPEPDLSKYRDLTPVELFELFWGDDILEHTVHQIKLYCGFKNASDMEPSVDELRVFLGIILYSGYASFAQRWMHWSVDPDLGSKIVQSAMRKNRFEAYMQFLHFQDNSCLDPNDRYTKLRPLVDHLQKTYLDHFIPSQDLSHDEALIEYFGRNSLKQHIIQKPIRFGYEVFCLNLVNGYLVTFELYQGRKGQYDKELAGRFGKSAATTLKLMDMLPDEKKDLPYHIAFDNRFTSLDLLCELKKRGYNATGTMRSNRVPKDCKLKAIENMKKEKRGTFAVAKATSEEGNVVTLVRWKDNNVVTVASTSFGSHPVGPVGRFSKEAKQRIQVERPHSIKKYNESMGGTDRQDQHVSNYRSTIRGKKWWFPVFTWLVDVSAQNAWLLGRSAGAQNCDTLLNFRRHVVNYYLGHYGTEAKGAGRKAASAPGEDDLRFDRLDHFITRNENNSRRRCSYCGSRSVYSCMKCNKKQGGLCPDCFVPYHKRDN